MNFSKEKGNTLMPKLKKRDIPNESRLFVPTGKEEGILGNE